MKLTPKLWLCLPLFLFLSCTGSQPTSSVNASGDWYKSEPYNNNAPTDPAINRFIVLPELGIIGGKISSSANSFVEVTKLLETNSGKLEQSISQKNGCSFDVIDYQHPVAVGSRKSITSNGKRYSGSLEFEILISLTEAKNIKERIQQVNSCLQAIPKLRLEPNQKDKDMKINLFVSRVSPTLKDAGKYRQKLLEFKSQSLREVTNFPNPAMQFDAEDTKCTSKGIVTVIDRKLSGIELDIDFDCRRLIDEQPIGQNNE